MQYKERIARAFMQRKEAKSSKVRCDSPYWHYSSCDTPRMYTDGTTVYSYGPHFPIARWIAENAIALTTEQWETGDYWKSGKAKTSVVTREQIDEVQQRLTSEGFHCQGDSVDLDGHDAKLWVRV
jgi:hypothetical protein